jgi:hypothetical protein|tara:strand:- start:41 stop:625 length:585 start_codon:yes stop_codon:yes gene_type:complete
MAKTPAPPNFWSNATLEPKRAFRFLVTLSIGGTDVQFLAKSVKRPSYTVTSSPHKFFNHTFHYPGRVEWGTVSLTLVDDITVNGAELLYDHLSEIGYMTPTSTATASDHTITKKTATAAMDTFRIEEKGTPSGTTATSTVGTWKLQNAFITSVDFGEHSYDTEDMIDIQLEIQYDWAMYSKGEYVASGASGAEK